MNGAYTLIQLIKRSLKIHQVFLCHETIFLVKYNIIETVLGALTKAIKRNVVLCYSLLSSKL